MKTSQIAIGPKRAWNGREGTVCGIRKTTRPWYSEVVVDDMLGVEELSSLLSWAITQKRCTKNQAN
jgi:hypothetical protein